MNVVQGQRRIIDGINSNPATVSQLTLLHLSTISTALTGSQISSYKSILDTSQWP